MFLEVPCLWLQKSTINGWHLLDQTKIVLRTGDRIIVKGGVYISKFRISVPKELAVL